MKEISVVLTMDCEPTTATVHAKASGPKDWEQGERALRGYFDIGAGYGFPPTYFFHPEAALGQGDVFNELASKGACLGLHLHPWKYSCWRHERQRYFTEYGGLSQEDQRVVLAEVSALWREGIGHRPLYFRPGSFSANDSVFKVMTELGFRGGSCSVPGRVSPDVRAIWTGAEPDPHRADADFRQVRGTLDLANVPLSVDYSALLTGPTGRKMHPDLRPDVDWHEKYGISVKTIADNILAQVAQRNPEVPVIVIVTHNHYEYSDPADPVTRRLKAALDAVCQACAAANVKPVGATLATITDRVLSMPAVANPYAGSSRIE